MKLPIWLRWIVGIILSLVLIVTILSNYSAGIYFAVGALITIIAVGLRVSISYLSWGKSLIFAAVTIFSILCVAIAGVALFSINMNGVDSCALGEKKTELELTEYLAKIEVANFAEGSFRVDEHVTYTKRESTCISYVERRGWESNSVEENIEKDFLDKIIKAEKRGLFMYEVTIPVERDGYTCCPDNGQIVIMNIPYNSFYDAQYADNLKIDEYLGKETIAWQSSYIDNIRFAYVPAPFYNIRGVLNPFIQLSKYDNKILALIGFIISSVFLMVVKPGLIDFIKDKLKNIFRKDEISKTRSSIIKKKINRN